MIELAQIEAARERIAGRGRAHAADPPAVRRRGGRRALVQARDAAAVNSFKIRGAANCVRAADPALVAQGLVTASAGNMAQGVAWIARELGRAGDDRGARARAGGEARRDRTARRRASCELPYDDWWQAIVSKPRRRRRGLLRAPVSDPAVMAGNGTIGLEILEDLPDVDAVVIPYGGGGLTVGIASALARAAARDARLHGRAGDGAPRSWRRARPASRSQIDYTPSWVDGSGSRARAGRHVAAGRAADRRCPDRDARGDGGRGARCSPSACA